MDDMGNMFEGCGGGIYCTCLTEYAASSQLRKKDQIQGILFSLKTVI